MFKLVRFLKGYRPQAIIAPLLKFTEAAFELIIPLIVADIIDIGIGGGDTSYVIKYGIIMVALGALGLGFSLSCQYLAAVSSTGYGTNLRKAMFSHINTLSFAELDKIGSSSLLTRITSDVNQTQTAVAMFIRLITRVPFIVVGSAVMAFTINARLALIFVAGAIVISVILFFIMRTTMPSYKKVQKRLDEVNELTEENLSGARVVRAFSKQDEEQRDFGKATDGLTKASEAGAKSSAFLNAPRYVVINGGIRAVVARGGY